MNLKMFFVVVLWMLILHLHSAELFQDFGMLSCSQQRNITIVIYGVQIKFMERFFHQLNELVQNEACFKVNVYLPYDERVIPWQGTANSYHHIERVNYYNSEGYLANLFSEKYIVDSIKRSSEDIFTGQQTLVFMIGSYTKSELSGEYFSLLKNPQNSGKLDVIIYCFFKKCHDELWMPFHRIIITDNWFLSYHTFTSRQKSKIF